MTETDDNVYMAVIGPFEANVTIDYYIYAGDTSGNGVISEIISFNINPIDDPDDDEPIDEDDDKTELTIPVSYHLFVSVGALVGLTFIAIKKKTRKQ